MANIGTETRKNAPPEMITIEGRAQPDVAGAQGLRAINALYSRLERKLWVDLCTRKGNLNTLKSSYIARYGISARMFNSLRYEITAKYNARIAVIEELINDRREAIAATSKKIKTLEKAATQLRADSNGISTYKEKIRQWRKAPGNGNGKKKKKPTCAVRLRKLQLCQLREDLQKTLFILHQKKRRLAILRHKLKKLEIEQESPALCFGSKKLFQAQFHLKENGYENHAEWLADWRFARSSISFWLGSHEEKARNQNAQYDPTTQTLQLRVPSCLEKQCGEHICIPVVFPNGQEALLSALNYQGLKYSKKKKCAMLMGKPVSYRVVERENRLYVQAMFEPQAKPVLTPEPWRGAIGIDLNADHIAMVETDACGNLVNYGSLPFNFAAKSSNQIEAILGDHLAVICERAQAAGKPIAYEDLNFRKKKAGLREKGGHRYASNALELCLCQVPSHARKPGCAQPDQASAGQPSV